MKSNYRKLWEAAEEIRFTREFWKRDIWIIGVVAMTLVLILACIAVPIANEIAKHF